MGKEKTEKVQVILLCIAFILFEVAIYIWLPYWQTILITLGFNLIVVVLVLQLIEKEE
ncbi:hypothetical protein ERAN111884_09760 [Erysipelothrix anatis]